MQTLLSSSSPCRHYYLSALPPMVMQTVQLILNASTVGSATICEVILTVRFAIERSTFCAKLDRAEVCTPHCSSLSSSSITETAAPSYPFDFRVERCEGGTSESEQACYRNGGKRSERETERERREKINFKSDKLFASVSSALNKIHDSWRYGHELEGGGVG